MNTVTIPTDFPASEHILTSPRDVRALIWIASQSGGEIVELGCNCGNTTRQLAQRFPYRIVHGVDWVENNRMTHENLLLEKPKEVGANAKHLLNVRLHNVDTREFEYPKNTGFIFIDADHFYEGIKHDTEKALAFANASPNPVAIAWHDYHGDCWPDVTRYLDELSVDRKLFHVEGTFVVGLFL